MVERWKLQLTDALRNIARQLDELNGNLTELNRNVKRLNEELADDGDGTHPAADPDQSSLDDMNGETDG